MSNQKDRKTKRQKDKKTKRQKDNKAKRQKDVWQKKMAKKAKEVAKKARWGKRDQKGLAASLIAPPPSSSQCASLTNIF